jgi:hypothetical protein
MAETVTVSAETPLINTTNAEIGVNFDVKRVSELPLAPNGNVLNLALSVAGVSQLSNGNSSFASGGVSFAVNGMRTRSNNFMVDGGDSNSSSTGGLLQEINNPDTVAEVRVITNQFVPEYGRAAGSQVNLLTKRGANDPHGSLFWFHNDNKLNSRSNLDKRTFTQAPWRVENRIGGTAGGPIVKDKTFFYGSLMRWTDRRFASGTAITGAPTADGVAALKGISAGRPALQAVLNFLPAAQASSGSSFSVTADGRTVQVPYGTLSGAAPNKLDDWQWMGRVDHNFSSKYQAGGRYLFDDRVSVSGQGVPPGLTASSPARRQSAGAWLTSTLSAGLFNETRFNYQRIASVTNAADANAVKIPSVEVTELGLTGFNDASSRTALGLAVNLPQSQTLNNYQISSLVGWIKSAHTMKFGIDFRRQEQFQDFNPTLRGRLQYNTLQDLVDDVAQVAAINVLLPGVETTQHYRYYDYFFFLQDEWHISNRLTLTYGIRYESPGNSFDYLKRTNDLVMARQNNNPDYKFAPVPPRDTNNWAPRIGFNYQLGEAPGPLHWITGDRKMVFRGGYGRTYDLIFNNITLNVFSAFPFTFVYTLPARTRGAFSTIDPIRAGTVLPPFTNLPQITRTMVAGDFRAPLAEQFSGQLQRELARNWAMTVGYVGTKGTALFQTIDGNPTVPGSGGTVRVNPNRGIVRLRANASSSVYHSLQTSLEKRLSASFSMAAHYTWSTFIDDASEVFNPSNSGEVAVSQDSFNRRADRGRSTYDRPHRFALNGVFELPYLRGQRGLLGHAIGGWQISGFLTLQAGAPFSALDGADPGFRLSGIDSLVGNAIRANPNTTRDLSSMSVEQLWNAGGRALFGRVTAGSPMGILGRNILRADGIGNVDLGINKNFRIVERHSLQFRAEFYNVSNTRNFGIPEARVSSANFANQWNTDGGNRRIVMGLRYTF